MRLNIQSWNLKTTPPQVPFSSCSRGFNHITWSSADGVCPDAISVLFFCSGHFEGFWLKSWGSKTKIMWYDRKSQEQLLNGPCGEILKVKKEALNLDTLLRIWSHDSRETSICWWKSLDTINGEINTAKCPMFERSAAKVASWMVDKIL